MILTGSFEIDESKDIRKSGYKYNDGKFLSILSIAENIIRPNLKFDRTLIDKSKTKWETEKEKIHFTFELKNRRIIKSTYDINTGKYSESGIR